MQRIKEEVAVLVLVLGMIGPLFGITWWITREWATTSQVFVAVSILLLFLLRRIVFKVTDAGAVMTRERRVS